MIRRNTGTFAHVPTASTKDVVNTNTNLPHFRVNNGARLASQHWVEYPHSHTTYCTQTHDTAHGPPHIRAL